jgi:hypothetical protein
MDLSTTYTNHSKLQVNYSAIFNRHTLQITIAPAKPFSSLLFLHQPFLATASNNGDSSASRVEVLSSQPPVQTHISAEK